MISKRGISNEGGKETEDNDGLAAHGDSKWVWFEEVSGRMLVDSL